MADPMSLEDFESIVPSRSLSKPQERILNQIALTSYDATL